MIIELVSGTSDKTRVLLDSFVRGGLEARGLAVRHQFLAQRA